MLVYLNQGERQYHEVPVLPIRRGCWEFQAVIDGRCGPTRIPGDNATLRSQSLWLFPPDDVHGWTGEPETPCQIVVAHFDQVPEPLSTTGPRVIALSDEQCQTLRGMFAELEDDYVQPTQVTALRAERLLLELSLIALADSRKPGTDVARTKASAALAWYAEHLPDGPGVEEVAKAVSTSPSHLRRLFLEAMSMSPLEAMKQVQHDRAKQLMAGTKLPLSQIARACGYSAQSVFSRDFAKRQQITPQAWRTHAAQNGG